MLHACTTCKIVKIPCSGLATLKQKVANTSSQSLQVVVSCMVDQSELLKRLEMSCKQQMERAMYLLGDCAW